ncbi:MAG: transcriptional regulator [Pseudomonadota bacterium]
MALSTEEDLAEFIAELRRETDRGLPLVASALIDDKLGETLRSFFCEGPSAAKLLDDGNAVLGTFSARIEACFALGLIDEFEHREITLIRKIRNEFAHAKHGISFLAPRVQGLCSGLACKLPEGGNYPVTDPRFRFMNSAVSIVLRLYHRPAWVGIERRSPKSWVSENIGQWRNVKTDPPPVGQPVIVFGKNISVATWTGLKKDP